MSFQDEIGMREPKVTQRKTKTKFGIPECLTIIEEECRFIVNSGKPFPDSQFMAGKAEAAREIFRLCRKIREERT